ncbi:MAG: hypothetical protein KC656_10400 [Myxococcales bacterium]|nr:hypothetical protein [Myxococcales bacterium]
MTRTCLIVNPRSGGGSTERRLEELRAAAAAELGPVELLTTRGPGDATDLTRRALAEGFGRLIAVGGDGTANEVVNGFFDGDLALAPAASFALVHAGTGGDLVKTLRVPSDPREAFRGIGRRSPVPTDVLHHRFAGHDGSPTERIGINVTGFGLNGKVVERANRSSKRFGGRLTFLGATIASIASYRPVPVAISWMGPDGDEGRWEGPLSSAFVANGEYCGGGMWVGRGGSMHDGCADLTLLPPLPLHRMISGGPRLFSGTIENVKEVSRNLIVRMDAVVASGNSVLIDIDGEQPGLLPITIRVLPKALLVTSFR